MSPTAGSSDRERPELVVIGGSAGALEPLFEILAALPSGGTPPVAIVLHLPRKGPSRLVETLAARSTCPVREAEDKAPLEPGVVYVAPVDYHLLVDDGPSFALSLEDPVEFSRPSIDVLFESAADVLGPRVAGVLLSGANADGARGLGAIARAGGATLVQAPTHASSPAMPKAALASVPSARPLANAELSRAVAELAANEETP